MKCENGHNAIQAEISVCPFCASHVANTIAGAKATKSTSAQAASRVFEGGLGKYFFAKKFFPSECHSKKKESPLCGWACESFYKLCGGCAF